MAEHLLWEGHLMVHLHSEAGCLLRGDHPLLTKEMVSSRHGNRAVIWDRIRVPRALQIIRQMIQIAMVEVGKPQGTRGEQGASVGHLRRTHHRA